MRDDLQTRRDFAAMLTATMAIYGKDAPDKPVLAMWFAALQRYELDEVRNALSRHVSNPDNGQFPPKPADVVRHIDGSGGGNAALAWAKLVRAVGSVGTHQSVVFDDPAIHSAVMDLGGWVWLGQQKTDDLPFIQRRFEASYRAHRERNEQDFPAKLCGQFETHNASHGYEVAPPVLVGDPDRCKMVLERGGSGGLRLTQLSDALPMLTRQGEAA